MHGGQFIASVNLVKALGGGWEGLAQPETAEAHQKTQATLSTQLKN
jgi:hypothetical protein